MLRLMLILMLQVYTYAELTSEGVKQLPGVDREGLEVGLLFDLDL